MFLQSAFLIGLAAVLIPIVVHLLSRQQIVRVQLGTTRFLMEVITDNSRRRRLRRWLLLLTRMATVALIALLFARPSLPTFEDLAGGGLRVLLVDCSASMQAPGQNGRAIDEALAMAKSEIDRLGTNQRVLWAAFDSHVTPIQTSPGSEPKINVTPAGDTSYATALAWARDQITAGKHVHAEVWLITDMQMTGLAGQSEQSTELLPADVPVRVLDIGRREVQNVAIQSIEKRTLFSPGESGFSLVTSIFNFGSMPADDVPTLAIITNGKQTLRLKKSIDIPSAQATEAVFDFGEIEPGLWQVTVDIDVADDLAFDNRRLAAFEVNHPDRILVIDSRHADASRARNSYFLSIALRASVQPEVLPEPGQETQELVPPTSDLSSTLDSVVGQFDVQTWYIDEQDSLNLKPNPPGLVVVANASELSAASVLELERYVQAGGKLLTFAGQALKPNALSAWHASVLAPGKLMQSESAATMPYRITDISAAASMLAPFLDPQQGDLSRLAFTSLLSVDVAQPERILAKFDGARPAITEHTVGAGRVAWFMGSADDSSGSWTTSPLYLPLVRQMAADLLGRTGEGPIRFRNVGDPLPDTDASPNASDSNRAQATKAIHPTKANPSKTESAAATEHLYFETPGFVKRGQGEADRNQALIVVNSSIKESDPTRVEATDLARQLGITLATRETLDEKPQAKASYYEMWPYLVGALIALLAFEYALSNRTSA